MPVLLDGLQVLIASFSPSPRSVLSACFRNLWPSNARTTSLLVTTLVGGHHAKSFPLAFQMAEHATFDVILVLDWAAFLRDSLLSLGYRLDSTFDAWRFVLDPTHPLSSNGSSAGHAQLPVSGAFMASGSAAGHVPRSRANAFVCLLSLILAGSPLSLIMSEPLSLLSPLPFVLHPMPTLIPFLI
ncbi:hypothetical protein B0H13DRAFT_2325133 [Mycena leptocephala]|nr:hypothetical protein B0H13DRAFT_2325133 [Mycena leptocephala]